MGVLNVEEELDKECNELFHFYQDKILKLEEENEQLKAQIEKMKNCYNCKNQDAEYGDCTLEIPICCKFMYENGSDEWELA